MALVIPYGDTQAHGSIGDTLTFRRWRGRVVLEKKPFPRQPNTQAQLDWRQLFRDGWDAYHNLNSWEIEYITNKSKELGRTPANFFMSQWLLDELPSTTPLNLIKKINEISLAQPVADEDKGIRFQVFAIKDDPFDEKQYGEIWDKENAYVFGEEVGDHDRVKLTAYRDLETPVSIPFNYPIIMKWTDFSDVDHTDLMRLPLILLPTFGSVPSPVPMTDIKRIGNFELRTPIGDNGEYMIINFQHWKDVGPEKDSISFTYDNRGGIGSEYSILTPDGTLITFRRAFAGIASVPAGYELWIQYLDWSDDPHEKSIFFPAFDIDQDGDAANMRTYSWSRGISGDILVPVGTQPFDLTFEFQAGTYANPGQFVIGTIHDNQNIFTPGGPEPTSIGSIKVSKTTPGLATVPNGYVIRFEWADSFGQQNIKDILFPGFYLSQGQDKTFFVAADFSLYHDKDYTNLAKKNPSKHKNLWLDEDFSLYWDAALTQLARSAVFGAKELWLADDFSLYWDQALTQLANTPFF